MADVHSSTVKCCTKCGASKSTSEFVKRKSSRDGLSSHCKACKSADSRRWYAENSDKKLAQNKAWAEANRERMKPYYAAYYQANREKYDELSAAWYRNNPEVNRAQAKRDYWKHREKRLAASHAYHATNLESIRIRSAEYRRANKEKMRALSRSYKARKKGAQGSHTGEDIKRLYVLQKGRCTCCRKRLEKGYHVDHIQALSKGGSNDWLNLQLLCPRCNIRKKDKDPLDFSREMGRLL
ncbi:HNH endonuclease [Ralstonia pseudosolanacearum]|uniref:HNH endonuclease n=1 Tax=Ralstonia solanacearum species complex TaxID=3116862 RepID=UPI00336A9E80